MILYLRDVVNVYFASLLGYYLIKIHDIRGKMMENFEEIIEQLNQNQNLLLEDIPNIDLYMDQVIQLFESKYDSLKRNENDKILTKTMINNYAKGKLFIPIKNKKYSKEHLILISLIYQLKGALSINDIKSVLEGINSKVIEGGLSLESLYQSYLHLSSDNVDHFKEEAKSIAKNAKEEIFPLDEEDSEYLEKVLLITSLVNVSNLYRRAAEKIVDQIVLNKQ